MTIVKSAVVFAESILAALGIVFWISGVGQNAKLPWLEILKFWSIPVCIGLVWLIIFSMAFYPKFYFKLFSFVSPNTLQIVINTILHILFYFFIYFLVIRNFIKLDNW